MFLLAVCLSNDGIMCEIMSNVSRMCTIYNAAINSINNIFNNEINNKFNWYFIFENENQHHSKTNFDFFSSCDFFI